MTRALQSLAATAATTALVLCSLYGCQGMLELPSAPDRSDPYAPGESETGDEPPGEETENTSETAETVRAPLRRLTRFEYNNTVRDLFGDTTEPGNELPNAQSGNGFGNDADQLSVSPLLIEKYESVAAGVAERATASPQQLSQWSTCVTSVTETSDPDTEIGCAEEVLGALLHRAFRRSVEQEEVDGFLSLWSLLREDASFEESLEGTIQAVLMSPEFLYRPEFGIEDDSSPTGRRPTGHEMATRLSYFLWSSTPDEELLDAAETGELDTPDGVRAHAERMLEDERSRPMLRFFFDQFLPIQGVAQAERSEEAFPDFTPEIGALMREETHRFLEHLIFEGAGDWRTALTADYTFLNGPLAEFYGVPGVSGDELRRVDVDPATRAGILTQGAFLVGTTHSNTTSPVKRGGFIVSELLCRHIPFPTGELADEITPPDPYSGDTARERYAQHSEDDACAGCHAMMDPAGFALENYDAVGRWRDTENGVEIDASAQMPGWDYAVDGPVEFVSELAKTEDAYMCLTAAWLKFALGRSDVWEVAHAVKPQAELTEYDIKALIVAMTQTDSFLYLPAQPE